MTSFQSKRRTLVALSLLICATVSVANGQQGLPLDMIEPFAGKTWRGLVNEERGLYDVAKWEIALAGKAVRIMHSVGDGVYGGETIIYHDAAMDSLVYYYFTTAGFYTNGTFRLDDWGRLHSRELVTGNPNGVTEVRSILGIRDDGRLSVKTRMRKNGVWQKESEIVYEEAPDAAVVLPARSPE